MIRQIIQEWQEEKAGKFEKYGANWYGTQRRRLAFMDYHSKLKRTQRTTWVMTDKSIRGSSCSWKIKFSGKFKLCFRTIPGTIYGRSFEYTTRNLFTLFLGPTPEAKKRAKVWVYFFHFPLCFKTPFLNIWGDGMVMEFGLDQTVVIIGDMKWHGISVTYFLQGHFKVTS